MWSGKDMQDVLRKDVKRRSINSPLWSKDVASLKGDDTFVEEDEKAF